MIPSFFIIRTSGKNRFRIFWREKIRVGLEKDCHVLINLPVFFKSPVTFAKNDPHGRQSRGINRILRLLFTVQRLESDDLSIRLLSARRVPFFLFIAFLVLLPLALYSLPLGENPTFNQDWTSISLPTDSAFGFCRQDRTHPLGVRFDFPGTEGKFFQIAFTPGGGEHQAVMGVSLNGIPVRGGIGLPSGWGEEISIPFPPGSVRKGTNTVEISVMGEKGINPQWGVRQVRVFPIDPPKAGMEATEEVLEQVRSLLGKPSQRGTDLARSYGLLCSIPGKLPDKNKEAEKENMKREIEKRMEERLKDALIQAKSKELMGDEESASMLIREARAWSPDNWPRGEEVLGGYVP